MDLRTQRHLYTPLASSDAFFDTIKDLLLKVSDVARIRKIIAHKLLEGL